MKILVFSDSHRSRTGMYRAIEAHQPDQVIHLGDLMRDVEEIAYEYSSIPFCIVPGNCDGWTTVPAVKLITLGGKTVLLSHGHLWGVKSGYEGAIAQGFKAGADILLFGHTHVPYCQQLPEGMWVVNPGPGSVTYALITIEDGVIHAELRKHA